MGLDQGSPGAGGGASGRGRSPRRKLLRKQNRVPCTRGIRVAAESQILEVQGHKKEALLVHARPSCFLAPNSQRQARQGQSSHRAFTSVSSDSLSPEARAGLGGDVPAAQTGKLRHRACLRLPRTANFLFGNLWTEPLREGAWMVGFQRVSSAHTPSNSNHRPTRSFKSPCTGAG